MQPSTALFDELKQEEPSSQIANTAITAVLEEDSAAPKKGGRKKKVKIEDGSNPPPPNDDEQKTDAQIKQKIYLRMQRIEIDQTRVNDAVVFEIEETEIHFPFEPYPQ